MRSIYAYLRVVLCVEIGNSAASEFAFSPVPASLKENDGVGLYASVLVPEKHGGILHMNWVEICLAHIRNWRIQMTDKKQHTPAESENQPDSALISTVTAAVLQTLRTTGNMPSENQNQGKPQQKPKTVDLVGLSFHILEKIWLVLLSAVVCTAVFGIAAGKSVTTYSATSKLYIVNSKSTEVNISDIQLGSVLKLDYQEVFKTWEVHEMVIEELDLPYTYAQMQSMLTITNPEDTRVLYITVTHQDAQMAADIANAYASAAKSFIVSTMKGEELSDFSVALEPSVGRKTSMSSSLILGFGVGTVLAVVVLALFFVLDNRPRSPEAIQQYGGIPTLTVFPANKDKKTVGRYSTPKKQKDTKQSEHTGNYLEVTNFPELDFVSNEAMNTLCTNISYCGKNIHKILITSRYAGEGKSYVSMNLLRTLTQLGHKTVLIDTDLRASGIQSDYRLRYSTQKNYGLSEYLSGICGMEDVIYQTDIPNAYMVPAGHEAPNPLQLLDTRAMEKMIDHLNEQFDIVLVDTPPVGVLVDAVALAKFCDGALLVVGYRKGKQREIGEAVEHVKRTGCKMLGAVLNGVKFNSMSNRYYYYHSERYSNNYNKRYYKRKNRK